MPIGSLWTDLMLNGAPFRKSLVNAAREVSTWAAKVKKEFKQAFAEEIGGRKGFMRARMAAQQIGREMIQMGESAQMMQSQFDLPADKLLALQEVSKATGISMDDLVKNLDEASGLMELLGKQTSSFTEDSLRAGAAWGLIGKNMMGRITGLGSRLLAKITPQSWLDEQERAAAQARGLSEDIRLKAALPGQLRARAADALQRASDLTPAKNLGGPLANIGGFTGGAGMGTLVVQKQQLDVLKLIEKHSELTAEALRIDPLGGP